MASKGGDPVDGGREAALAWNSGQLKPINVVSRVIGGRYPAGLSNDDICVGIAFLRVRAEVKDGGSGAVRGRVGAKVVPAKNNGPFTQCCLNDISRV